MNETYRESRAFEQGFYYVLATDIQALLTVFPAEPGCDESPASNSRTRHKLAESEMQEIPVYSLDALVMKFPQLRSQEVLPRGTTFPATLGKRAGAHVPTAEEKLNVELAAFERMRAELLPKHRGLFVAIHHGRVIDSDEDDFELAARIEDKAISEGAIAICRVCERHEEEEHESPYADFESPSLGAPY